MPVSKSKRKRYQPPPKKKPEPSPRWVPVVFFILLGAGFLTIVARYVGSGVTFLNKDYLIWVGLGLIAAAFTVATQWR
jgi:hypothetical protein